MICDEKTAKEFVTISITQYNWSKYWTIRDKYNEYGIKAEKQSNKLKWNSNIYDVFWQKFDANTTITTALLHKQSQNHQF